MDVQQLRSTALKVGGAALALLVAYAFGRWGTPTKVVIQEKVRVETVEHQVVVNHETVRVERVEVASSAQATHREVTRVRRPDRTVETRVVTDTASSQHTASSQAAEGARSESSDTQRATEMVREHVEERTSERPAWRLTALAGLELGSVLKLQLRPVYGAALERRVLGPISAGVWGLNSGVGGVAVSLEW